MGFFQIFFLPLFQQHSNGKTKFTDLNADCLFLIFDQLELTDWMNVAQINREFLPIVSYMFRQKYSGYIIAISDTKREWYEKPCSIRKSSKYIFIKDYQLALNILKYFGNNIRNLSIRNPSKYNFTPHRENWATINQVMNKYGSESISKLLLGRISKELWSQFSVPFKNLELLDIEIETDTDGMKLNWLCPKLKQLRLNLVYNGNCDFIDCAMPYLEHLYIEYPQPSGDQRDQIIDFFRKNPQIRNVDVRNTTPDIVKVISEYLPNIENLKLASVADYKEPIHFENVKNFVLHSSQYLTIKNLTFPHLESFETTYSRGEFEKFIEFFRKHRCLKRLKMSSHDGIELDVMTADLVNLMEMIMENNSEINISQLIRFIETHPKLMKFKCKINEMGRDDQEILRQRFERDWHIFTNKQDNMLLFERI